MLANQVHKSVCVLALALSIHNKHKCAEKKLMHCDSARLAKQVHRSVCVLALAFSIHNKHKCAEKKLILFASALAFSKNVSFSYSSSSEENFYSKATIKFLF